MIDTIKVEMNALDIIIDMAGQIVILHNMMIDATTTMITILHLVDSDVVNDSISAKTWVIIIIMVMVVNLTINKITETRTEAIINMTTISWVTLTINATTSHTMGIGKTLNKTTLLRNPLCQICLASSHKMVLGLRLGTIRFFKTPAQKSNCTYYPVTRYEIKAFYGIPIRLKVQTTSSTISMCHIDMFSQTGINRKQFAIPTICLGKVYMMLLLQKRIEICLKQIILYRVIILVINQLE